MTENVSNEWAMEPRVRVRARVVREALRITTDPLRSALHDAERRFLAAQRDATHGTPGALSEYLTIMTDLGTIDERLEEVADRRDVSYLTNRRLSRLKEHCRWLARRVSADFLLALQVRLEQELKEIIGPDAYQMFLRFPLCDIPANPNNAYSEPKSLDDCWYKFQQFFLRFGIAPPKDAAR